MLYSDVLILASQIKPENKMLKGVHKKESLELQEAIKNASQFSQAQKSLTLLHLAAYTKSVSTVLQSFESMSAQLITNLE